jgi:hypothetical protein
MEMQEDQILDPLKDWLRPRWQPLLSQWTYPEYVAVSLRTQGPGWDYDRIFDLGFSEQAWGCKGAIPRAEIVISGCWWVIPTKHLADLDTRWVRAIRRLPSPEEVEAERERNRIKRESRKLLR